LFPFLTIPTAKSGFKQYTGAKAKFKTEAGEQIVTAFTHHIKEFTEAATAH
jgi:hypothetical protein